MNSVKINDKIFHYIKKTLFLAHFWSIFPIFWAKIFSLENTALSPTALDGFIANKLFKESILRSENSLHHKRLCFSSLILQKHIELMESLKLH